jgi:hypothetical protein
MRTEVLQESRDVSDNALSHELSFEEVRDSPPDGGYGWVCVACCFTINAFTWGVLSVSSLLLPSPSSISLKLTSQSYGVYLSYYLQNNVFPSANTTDFALIGGPQPNIRLHRRLLRLPDLAALPHSRLTRRLRYRPHLDPKHRCPTPVVPKKEEYGKRHLFSRFRNRRDNLLVRSSRNHVELLACLGSANVRLGERIHEYPRHLRDPKQKSHRATATTSFRCSAFQTL